MGKQQGQGVLDHLTRQDEVLKAILKQLREGAISVDTLNIDLDSNKDAEKIIENALEESFGGSVLPFPFKRSERAFPAASKEDPIQVDFVNGEIDIPGVGVQQAENSLAGLDQEHAFSGTWLSDVDLEMIARRRNGRTTGKFKSLGGTVFSASQTEIAEMDVISSVPFILNGSVSTSTSVGPTTEATPQTANLQRFGHQNNTSDTFATVDFIPAISSTSDDYGVATKKEAVSTFGDPTLPTARYSNNLFIVDNVGSNDLDLQVLMWHINDANADPLSQAADQDIHSTTNPVTASITVSPTDAPLVLESSVQATQRVVRVKNSTPGSSSEVEIQYLGTLPAMR